MTIPITTETVLFLIAVLSVIFNIYHFFKKPQDKSEKDVIRLTDEVSQLKKDVIEVREKHLASIEKDVKELTTTINTLSITVTRLSTIIDERIPKGALQK